MPYRRQSTKRESPDAYATSPTCLGTEPALSPPIPELSVLPEPKSDKRRRRTRSTPKDKKVSKSDGGDIAPSPAAASADVRFHSPVAIRLPPGLTKHAQSSGPPSDTPSHEDALAKIHDAVIALREELRSECEAMRSDMANLREHQRGVEEEEEERELAENFESLYAFGMHSSMEPSPELAVRLLLLTALTLVESMLCFSFLNASRLDVRLAEEPAFMNPVGYALFYPDTVLLEEDWPDSVAPPPVSDIWVSCIAAVMMAFYLKQHTARMAGLMQPVELLIWGEAGGVTGEPWQWLRSPARIWHPPLVVLTVLLRQLLWCIRIITVPVMAGAGSGYAYAVSDDASNIVLNACAIVFVFDIDELLYTNLISVNRRDRHEKACAAAEASDIGRRLWLAQKLSWATFVIDLVSIIGLYLEVKFPHMETVYLVGSDMLTVRNWIYYRGAFCALTQLVITVTSPSRVAGFRNGSSRAKAVVVLQIVLQALVGFVGCILSFVLLVEIGYQAFGFRDELKFYPYSIYAGEGVGDVKLRADCLSGAQDCQDIHAHNARSLFTNLTHYVCSELNACPVRYSLFGNEEPRPDIYFEHVRNSK